MGVSKPFSARFWLALLFALWLPLSVAAGENTHGMTDGEWAEWKKSQRENPSYMLDFQREWPGEMEIVRDVNAAGYNGAELLQGYASRRFGAWQFAEAVLHDREGYILLCASYDGAEDRWKIAASRKALRQEEAPRLLPEGVEHAYDEYDVSQSDGCSSFQLVYPDHVYRWMHGSKGFMLVSLDDMYTSPQTISRETQDGKIEYAFATQSVFLDEFDISLFPTTFEKAQALAAASPFADAAKAVTTLPQRIKDTYEYWVILPRLRLLEKPEESSVVTALVFDGVEASVLRQEGAYVQISLGTLTGWMRRDCLLIGTERAAEWSWKGEYAQAYAYGGNRTQPLYASASREAEQVAEIQLKELIYVQAMTPDGSWYVIRLEDETLGWMPFDTVSETSNYYDAWIYSKDASRRLNLRAGPGKKYESLGKYYSGVHVVNLFASEEAKGWSHIIIEGASGWVDSSYLESYADYGGLDWLPPLRQIRAGSEGCPVYRKPDKNSEFAGRNRADGTPVEVMGVTGEWAHVRFRDGTSGYIELKQIGGEPKEADSNSFPLPSNAQLTSYEGQPLNDALKKGAQIKIDARPASQWVSYRAEAADAILTQEFVENPRIYVRVLGQEDGLGGYLYADEGNFWGE